MKKFLPLLVVVFLAGCRAGLSNETRQTGESVSPAIGRMSDTIAGFERDHRSLLNSARYARVKPFAARAGFDENLREVRGHLERARGIYQSRVLPALNENRAESSEALLQGVREVRAELDLARNGLTQIAQTRESLLKAATDLPSFERRLVALEAPLLQRKLQLGLAVKGAQKKHSAKRVDLEERLEKFGELVREVQSRRSTVKAQSAEENPDLLLIVRLATEAEASATQAESLAKDLEKRIADLDHTVTRRLEDMRLEYEVTFARSSWDEYSDYDAEDVQSLRPVKVSLAFADRLSKHGGEVVDEGILRQAGVDPYENLPSGHNSYEFWIEEVDDEAYHKYVETVDGKSTATDWVPVDDALFERHEKDLGMEIYVKPYGMYADEAITTATPPGMAFVGNPRFGRWNGSTWNWLPAYLFYSRLFDGNHFYQRDQWNRWNQFRQSGQPYYGEGEREEERPYGTNGRLGRVYYGNSNWGRTSGFRSYDLSFRGLGPEYRGGGPGGGGK